MHVSGLFHYPLKSARGIAVTSSEVDAYGLFGDRRLLLVQPDGQFVTQREMPQLAQIQVQHSGDNFSLSMAGKGTLSLIQHHGGARKDVAVWRTIISAATADASVDATLSEWLGRPLELVFFDEHSHRHTSKEWVDEETPVSFSDGFPVLVTTTGSLAALNADMEAHGEGSVGMERFRPNIVIDHDEPWADDFWAAIEIGGIRFELVKPCTRCIMTTQDQETGSREVASPMPAMGRMRMSADRRVPGPLFGWNAAPRNDGTVNVGDAVTVVEVRPEGWALKRRR